MEGIQLERLVSGEPNNRACGQRPEGHHRPAGLGLESGGLDAAVFQAQAERELVSARRIARTPPSISLGQRAPVLRIAGVGDQDV